MSGYLQPIADNDTLRTSAFEMEIPSGVGTFDVTSKCGEWTGSIQIEEVNGDRYVMQLRMIKPRKQTVPPR